MEEVDFYSNEIKIKKKKALVLLALICFLLFLSIVTLLTLTIVFVNRSNSLYLEIISIVVGEILTFVMIYFIINKLIPLAKEYKHISFIIKEVPIVINNAKIIEIDDSLITLSSGIKCYQVRVCNSESENKSYYLAEFIGKNDFSKDDTITLKIVSSYIVGCTYEK